jgi:hypothetical protein
MTVTPMEKFCYALNLILTRIKEYCSLHKEKGQPFGLCTANPKRASIGVPTKEIQAELEKRARDHFTHLNAVGFYFRYWAPPLLPVVNDNQTDLPISADDYQLTFQLPQFDEQWERTTVARSLIYCPGDQELHDWSKLFEIQEEAIRFTPLLHHSLKKCQTCGIIRMRLGQLGMPLFENFIYKYAKTALTYCLRE